MRITYRNTFIGVSGCLITILAVWSTLTSMWPENKVNPLLNEQPDAYMENVSATFMDKFGKPKMKIVTPKMLHYATNDMTHLTSPQVTLYRKSPQPWFISSHYAKATHGIDNIDFREDVMIHHPGDETLPATIIKAPTLIVHPNKETAETNEHVELIQPNLTVMATGMRANINSGSIMLLSQAKGEYLPDTN